uniref:Uncharacterized protein n=2 Tax=Aegilops tauschii TaxID=37682 RepID=A0A453A4E7_AEGTS|nr:tumor necrosis factor ligand superfamily member 6 [Aegilops tauschii subsp. strangulata]ACT34067.1 predicted protein [Aegilops tauschii]
MAAHGKPKPKPPGAPLPPPPPPPPPTAAEAKKGFMRRMFPFLLAVNAFVGAYMLVRTYYKDSPAKTADSAAATATASTPSATAESPEPPVATPAKVLPPIPEDEQRRVYKWMLEEKRKVKPRDAAEKKRLDDDKALLKQIIRADTLPVL